MYRKILIATDGSKSASAALDQGLALAKATGAAVTILYATPMWSTLDVAHAADAGSTNPVANYEAAAAQSAHLILDQAAARAAAVGVPVEVQHVPDKSPASAIVDTATTRGCDLIVMGTHGRRGMERLLLGSQVSEVLASSKVSVLVVR
jgi:nucleotide-binding universal stress UspA family protein